MNDCSLLCLFIDSSVNFLLLICFPFLTSYSEHLIDFVVLVVFIVHAGQAVSVSDVQYLQNNNCTLI